MVHADVVRGYGADRGEAARRRGLPLACQGQPCSQLAARPVGSCRLGSWLGAHTAAAPILSTAAGRGLDPSAPTGLSRQTLHGEIRRTAGVHRLPPCSQ